MSAAAATGETPSTVRGIRDQTGKEHGPARNRPLGIGHRAAASVTAMDITIHASLLPYGDPDTSPACCLDAAGSMVRIRESR